MLEASAGSATDLSVLQLAADGRVGGDDDFVFFNNRQAAGGAVRLRGGDDAHRCRVDLNGLPDRVIRIVFVASTERPVPGEAAPRVTVTALSGWQAMFSLPGTPPVTALVLAEMYRRDGAWRLRAIGQGYQDGLAGRARDFGVDVDSVAELIRDGARDCGVTPGSGRDSAKS